MLIVKYFTFPTKNISFCNATAARYFYGDVRHSQHLFNVMAGKIIVLGFGLSGTAMYSFKVYNQRPEGKYSLRSLFSGKTSHLKK